MVGESGPKSAGWSTIVGESEGSLPEPRGISTKVGESEASPLSEPGTRVGESEGRIGRPTEPGDELSPLEGVRTAAPPSPGSDGFPSGRPREKSSISDLDP